MLCIDRRRTIAVVTVAAGPIYFDCHCHRPIAAAQARTSTDSQLRAAASRCRLILPLGNRLQFGKNLLRPAQVTAHIPADFYLNFGRRLAAKMRKKARNLFQPIKWHPAPCGQRAQLPLGQPTEPILNPIQLLNQHHASRAKTKLSRRPCRQKSRGAEWHLQQRQSSTARVASHAQFNAG